jgi:hypothetical protein
MLTVGTLLLFGGGLMAIAATTPMGAGALISGDAVQQMGYSILIATIISFVGAIMIVRNR